MKQMDILDQMKPEEVAELKAQSVTKKRFSAGKSFSIRKTRPNICMYC